MLIGEMLAIASAVLFGLSSILIREGMVRDIDALDSGPAVLHADRITVLI